MVETCRSAHPLVRDGKRGRKPIDIAGERYGRLVATGFSHRLESGMSVWSFSCDCGTTNFLTTLGNVRSGQTRSCGCLRNEILAAGCGTDRAKMWAGYYAAARENNPAPVSCRNCQSVFSPLNVQVNYCSDDCRRKASWSSRNALRKKATSISVVNPFVVFTRANWKCESCGRKLSRKKRGTFGPDAPEIDHILPLSKGGEHSYSNTRSICRSCNIRKLAKPEGQMWLGLEVTHG